MLAAWAAVGLVASARVAWAHQLGPRVVREIVRLQGYVGDLPRGVASRGELTLQVFSERYALRVTDWQVFGMAENAPPEIPPRELRLQGDRQQLARLADVADRRVTVLAERRPGSSEIFLLALDLCPPLPAEGS